MGGSLIKDPYSIIITGVGGQGNVMASRILGGMFVNKGYYVTIGETFGASQRGGSVMSHLRISESSIWSPQIPRGRTDIIVSLEPIEAIRVLADFGNPDVKVISNTRSIYPVDVIKGDAEYPLLDDLKPSMKKLVPDTIFIDATEEALRMGNPILANIIMLGTVCGMEILPLDRTDFHHAISRRVSPDKVAINLDAFDLGYTLARQ